jgi:carboxyl-terminal processing protease
LLEFVSFALLINTMKRGAGIIFRSAFLILVGIAIGLLVGDNNFSSHYLGATPGKADKLSKVLQLVRQKYVDSVNVDSVEGVTVNNLLQNLDPHSMYLPPQQALAINEKLEGGFNGFGIEYQLLRDTVIITQIYPGGPADKAGLTSGDRVISLNDQKFSGTKLSVDKVDKIFTDEKNKEIVFNVLKPNQTVKVYHIRRGHVALSSLDAAYMVTDDVGYIKISKFASTTDNDFRYSLGKLKAQGMKKLVLDIRGNGGGYLNTATALANEFLTKGKLIVYTKGIHETRTDYFATDSGAFQQGKLAVLIDEYSASASEILAGALQDLDRAIIVGRRSFGKGLVQEQFPFADGSAVNLTVARYYTPSGRSIQKSYAGGIDSYHNELAERMKKGELFSAQSNLDDSIFKKPSPYRTLSGKKVFSGGGIMPDIFVPADTTLDTYLVQQLADDQVFTAYVIDKLQPDLNKYTSADDFINHYSVNDLQYGEFILYASQTLKEIDSNEIRISKEPIETLLKAYAARFKWGDEAYYQTVNSDDVAFRRAVEAVR